MVCIYCGDATQVINSRHQKRTNSVWRRRKCLSCKAVFTTNEAADLAQAFSIMSKGRLHAFQRDQLLISVYESLKHRKTALSDAMGLTDTVIKAVTPLADDAVLERDVLVTVTTTVLERFDTAAYSHYKAFHPA